VLPENAGAYAYVSIPSLRREIETHKRSLAMAMARRRNEEDETGALGDLDQFLALSGLFDLAFAATVVAEDGRTIDHHFGLVSDASSGLNPSSREEDVRR
jgi:hypothetical protein